MLVEFPKVLITGKRTGTSAKTGNAWGRLQFFDGHDNWDVFIPSDKLGLIDGMEVGRSYECLHFDLSPSFSGGVNLVPCL